MDTRLGALRIPPGSLFVVPFAFQVLILQVAYDRAMSCRWLRRATGYAGGRRRHAPAARGRGLPVQRRGARHGRRRGPPQEARPAHVGVPADTARGGGGGGGHGGWLDGASLNTSRLNLFYWLLAVLGIVAFFLYLSTRSARGDTRL